MTSARFVGRSGQLAELEAALRDAADRRPSLALIAGESGVGKSRLAGELVDRARAGGALVLVGDCVELGEGELPYAPLIGALRGPLRDEHPAFDSLPGPLRTALAAVVPGFGDRAVDADASQASVFEALLALFDAMGEDQPVLLVIEDLHWADSSTRAFLGYLSRMLCSERLLVVGTYRSDELHRRHPLRPLLAELERDARARRVELKPLTRSELAEQLTEIMGSPPDAALVERLYAGGEGVIT
jgi:predicted ATPase